MPWENGKSSLAVALVAATLLAFGCGDDDSGNDNNNPANSNENGELGNPFGDLNVEELAACSQTQLATGNAVLDALTEAFGTVADNAQNPAGGTFEVEGEYGGTATLTLQVTGVSSTTNLPTGNNFTIQLNNFGTPPDENDVAGPTVSGTASGQLSTGELGANFNYTYTADVVLDGTTEVEMIAALTGPTDFTVVYTIDGDSCNLTADF